jgi:hypothetical protein
VRKPWPENGKKSHEIRSERKGEEEEEEEEDDDEKKK